MKRLCILFSLALAGLAAAQTPDVSIVTDIRFTLEQGDDDSRFRFYDAFARHSTVSLGMNLETGYRAKITQRFARIDRDTMGNILEEATISAPGLWRIGYFEAKFGSGFLIRDQGFGAELSTVLAFDAVPAKVAVLDNGKRRVKGVVARIGDRIGLSVASGDHFAASATSLTNFRRPQFSPGVGKGYKAVYGADARFTTGRFLFAGEALYLRQANVAGQPNQRIVDLSVRWRGKNDRQYVTLGVSRELREERDALRMDAEYLLNDRFSVTGFLWTIKGDRAAGIGARVTF